MKRNYILFLACLLMLQVIAAFSFCARKAGFHYDEYYSYYSSNVSRGLVPTDREWKSGGEIRDEFRVLPGERFRFPTVVRMQTYDVHPPVYYLLLHAVCSLTPGVFSVWPGFAVNLLFFILSFCMLAWLAWHLSGRKITAVFGTCLLYGFNPAVLSGLMLMRMYTLLGFFLIALTCLHVRALETGRRGLKFYIPVMTAVYLGFLTHYYFAVYLFFLAAAMEFYLLFQRAAHKKWSARWKDCILYGAAVTGALAGAVLSYPASLGHIFRGYRGTEAMGAFFDADNTAGRIRFFAGLLNEYAFGSLLPFFLLVLVLLAFTAWALSRLRSARFTSAGQRPSGPAGYDGRPAGGKAAAAKFCERHRAVLIPAAAVAGYFAVVTKTALLTAEEANRYQLPVYGLFLLFSVTVLVLLVQKNACLLFGGPQDGAAARVRKKRFVYGIAGGMLLLLSAAQLYGLKSGRVLFLYEEDAANIAAARENRGEPVVYFYNQPLTWMIWDDSLELMQYDSIYFVNMADTAPLADSRLSDSDRVLVYTARGDSAPDALNAVSTGCPQLKNRRKIRELLYCDLYEFTSEKIHTE